MNADIFADTSRMSREEWLKVRTQGIGGSDVSVIAGINPYRSVYQLWLEKTGQVEHWAARHGYNDRPKEILEKAKKSSKGRYACVNISNVNTVEIRMFRGTLKWNTFMATLELVDAICENAIRYSDRKVHQQSWTDFVMELDPGYTELIKYLKEKMLYVNDPVEIEEEL